MLRKKVANQIAHGLVIGFGCFFFWHFNLFRPVNFFYPPPGTYTEIPPDYILASPGGQYNGSLFRTLWLGEHLRPLWTTPVKVKLFGKIAAKHGFTASKKGGGMQTTRFTLESNSGEEFSLRSIDKNPAAVIVKFLWPTVALGFVRDQISATDPYAMFVVASLARHADISHSEPELVYVMLGEPALGELAGKNQGFFSLEPRQENTGWLTEPGEVFVKMYETDKMQKILESQTTAMQIDTSRYLKCRLFDLLIGDWDRHAGQWNWLTFSGKNYTIFRPVPKDRDQALGYYQDGILPWILSRNFAIRKISSFTMDYEDLDGFLQNGRPVDQWLLKHLSENEFKKAAQKLQKDLPDEVLAEAVKNYPPVFAETRALEVFKTLQQRRDNLQAAASMFYQNIHQEN